MQPQLPQQPRLFSTIYLRLFVPFSIALLLGTVIAWWIGTTVLYRTLDDRVLQQLNHAVDLVSEQGFPVTEPVVTRMNNLLGASILLFDSNGDLLHLRDDMNLQTELPGALKGRYLKWRAQDKPRGVIYFSVNNQDYLMVLRQPLEDIQLRYQAVAALTDLSDVRKATRRGGLWLAGFAVAGITLLAFIGHWIARSITLPVGELAAMAGSLASGDRAVRVDVRRRDEVGALAQSLNSMAERLTMYEQQVAEQSRLLTLGELSAKVAHEIRNPLTAIKMQLQMLQDDAPESAKPRVNSLIDEVRRLELIVTATLQLGQTDKLDRHLLDLNKLVIEMINLLEPQFEHRGIEAVVDLASNLPHCQLDANRVKQILLNLLNNAADELTRGGRVDVSTRWEKDRGVVLEVQDSGPGVPPDQRDTLFEQASSDKPSGFGLGLRVSRELVELHGGTIEVSDSGLGGALFRVVFPVGS